MANRVVMEPRLLLSSFLALLLITPLASPASSSAACDLPQPQVRYSADQIVVSLQVDYSGCRWWTGGSIDMSAELKQSIAGTPMGQGVAALKGCVGINLISKGQPSGASEPTPIDRCRIRVRLDHDPIEKATYSGTFTFPWRNGDTQVEFSYEYASLFRPAPPATEHLSVKNHRS